MEILETALISLGISATYILVTFVTSFITQKKLELPDIVNWRIVISNGLVLAIPFFMVFWGLPKVINSVELSEVVISGLIFMVISIVPTYEFLIAPLFIIRNEKLIQKRMTVIVENTPRPIQVSIVDKEFANAYAIGVLSNTKAVLISRDLVSKMTPAEINGLIAHEIGHLEKNHLFKLYLSSLLALLIGYLSTFYFYPIIENSGYNIHILRGAHGALFYGFPTFLIPGLFQRKFEYQADVYASKLVGEENYINSLIKLDDLTNGSVTRGGLTHPPLEKRKNKVLGG